MPKILRAIGEHGKRDNGKSWNWCDHREPVGWHNFVCCNSARCGCNRSFVGIWTAKATTHAIVSEVSQDDYNDFCNVLESCYARAWNARCARDAVALFDILSEELNSAEIGDIICVRLGEESRLLTGTL